MILVLVLLATIGAQTLAANSLFIVPATAPAVSKDLGVSTTFIGYQVSIVYLAAMIISVVAGSISSIWGPVRTSQTALLLGAVGLALATIHSLPTFIVASLATGAGYGLINPPSGQMLEKVSTPANRSIIFSIKQTSVPIGGVVAGLLGPPLALRYGWEFAFLTSGMLSLVMIALLQPFAGWFDREPRPDRAIKIGASPFRDIAMVWATTELRWLAISAFCFAAVQFTLTTYLVTLLVEDVHLSLIAAGIALSVFQFAAISGRIAWGVIADATGSGMETLLLAFGLAAFATLPLIWMNGGWSMTAIQLCLAVLGVSGAGWNGVFVGQIVNLAPAGTAGRAIGGAFAFTFAGALVGPSCFAIVHGWLGLYTHTVAVVAIFAFGGFICCALAMRARRADAARSTMNPWRE